MDSYYKYKYIKYKQKYSAYLNNFQMKGGNSVEKIISSKHHKMIYVKPTDESPGYMKFENDKNNGVFQTIYDINNIDWIYLSYLYPLITVSHYVNLNKLLFIGLGGGYMPMLFRSKFPNCQINIIELDEAVVNASKEMGFTKDDKMNVYIGDGIAYCNTSNENDYDVIFIDIANDFLTASFDFERIKKLLNDTGIVAINVITPKEVLSKHLFSCFSRIKIYTVDHNYIYLCYKKIDHPNFDKPLNNYTASPNMKKFKYFDKILFETNKMIL